MEHMVQQQAATKSLRKREEGFGGNQGPAAFFQPAPLPIQQNPGPVISRSVADTSECSRTKDPGAPPEPLISIILSDTLAGMLLSQAILSLKLDQMTPTGNISGDGFNAYRKRFGDPVASRGKFKDRFDGTSHDTLASAQASEMNSLAKRLEKASSVLAKDINYYCLGGKAGGHGFSKCKPGDVLKSHDAENSIAICPDFWTTLTGQREIGIIHELFHIKYWYGDHDTAPFAQSAAERLSEPECYASFVADVNKVTPFDPSCPAVQPKLAINPPNDVYEQEADKVAGAVMSGSIGPIQRKCAACEEEEKVQRKCAHCEEEDKKIQRKEASDGSAAPSHTSVKQALQSGGQPLDGHTRSFMESRFGYDFSRVQIHDDPLAHRSSSEINALAYTHGNHIVFGAGKYRPETAAGKQLLAHELTHVVQQNAGGEMNIQRKASAGGGGGVSPDVQGAANGGKKPDTRQKCPPAPTGIGDIDPDPPCPKASHAGTTELTSFNFCQDSNQLIPDDQATEEQELEHIVTENLNATRFLVHGYSSIEGDPAYNFRLACHRAHTIAEDLGRILGKRLLEALLPNGLSDAENRQRVDAEVERRIETASQGPTTEFEGGAAGNRIVIIYGQNPKADPIAEPDCKDAPNHIGDAKPEINCDAPTVDIASKPEGSQLKRFHFCLDSDTLVPNEGPESIRNFVLGQAASAGFIVHGFASVEGKAAYNKQLSCNRALRIFREMINAGVKAGQIHEVSGLGATSSFSNGDKDKDLRTLNRVAVVSVDNGKIDPLKDGKRKATTPAEKQAIVKEARDKLISGQYQLAADAYIALWTCGRTATLRQAVERLTILVNEKNDEPSFRAIANGTEEGIGVNTILVSNATLNADNPIECAMGRIIDMAFHQAVVGDPDLNPNPTGLLAENQLRFQRHLAGLHLIAVAGLSACTGAGTVPKKVERGGRTDFFGIDKPIPDDPRKDLPPLSCAETPQPTHLLTPSRAEQKRDKSSFAILEKDFKPAAGGTLTANLIKPGAGFISKPGQDMANFSAVVQLFGKPDDFSDYEVGFIQAIIDDQTLAEYESGHVVVQQLPLPIRVGAMKGDIPAPAPWTGLTAKKQADSSGKVSLDTGFRLSSEGNAVLSFFKPTLPPSVLFRLQRHSRIALWLAARRIGAPLDRFSVIFLDGSVYDLSQTIHTRSKHIRGDLGLNSDTDVFELFGEFQGSEIATDMSDPSQARFAGPVASDISLNNQTRSITAPPVPASGEGMRAAEFTEEVRKILDNLEVFPGIEDAKQGKNGKLVPRLGFVNSELKIHIAVNKLTRRIETPEPGRISVHIESPGLGVIAINTLNIVLDNNIKRAESKGHTLILHPSAMREVGDKAEVLVVLAPLEKDKPLIEEPDVFRDMAELFACTVLASKLKEPREFGVSYWRDRDKQRHRVPTEGFIVGNKCTDEGCKTNLLCDPNNTEAVVPGASAGEGHAIGTVHSHPPNFDTDPSPDDKNRLKEGTCGSQSYIVTEEGIFAFFADGTEKSFAPPPAIKCNFDWHKVQNRQK